VLERSHRPAIPPRPGVEPPQGRESPSSGRDLLRVPRGTALDDPAALETEALVELVGGSSRVAGRPLRSIDLVELSRTPVVELVAVRGLARGGARRLAAAFELGRRLRHQRRPLRPSVRSPQRVLRLLEDEVRGCEQERFFALLLDGKHALRRIELVSVGTLTTSLVHPREVFRPAVREASAALVCAHNHPSGDPEPSAEDVEVTRRLVETGRLLGIPLLDHVVLGEGRYVSLRERMGF
jgi:DNA repair protein RadC